MEEKELTATETAEEVSAEAQNEETAAAEPETAPADTAETAPAGEPSDDAKEAEQPIDWFAEITDILETMLISVFTVLLIFGYFMRPVTVDGRSMVPTLYNEDKLVMFRLFYQPHVGDVVVVNNHGGHIFAGDSVVDSGASLDECIIKRVIANSGQKLEIKAAEGQVYVDDVLLDEPYINELTLTDDRAFEYPITIPDGYVFVMGDNRNHSSDSRSLYVGLVDKDDVMGRAFFRYQPAKDPDTGEKLGTVGFIK